MPRLPGPTGATSAIYHFSKDREQLVRLDGLSNVPVEPGGESFVAVFDAGESGEGNRRNAGAARIQRANAAEKAVSIFAAEADVANHKVWARPFERLDRRIGRLDRGHLGTGLGKQLDKCGSGFGFVLN